AVYADSAGLPGAAICASTGRPASTVYAAGVRRIQLNSTCSLGPGNYWMGLKGRVDADNSIVPNWSGGYLAPGGEFVYRNPSDSTQYHCTSWSAAGQCIAAQAATQPCFMLERDEVFDGNFE